LRRFWLRALLGLILILVTFHLVFGISLAAWAWDSGRSSVAGTVFFATDVLGSLVVLFALWLMRTHRRIGTSLALIASAIGVPVAIGSDFLTAILQLLLIGFYVAFQGHAQPEIAASEATPAASKAP